ncbi:MAG: hypothetical protein ACXWP0_10200 [Ktedonobacterales bacterium]
MPSHLRASSTTNWPILRRTIACADRGYPETYQCGSRRHPERWGGRAWKKSEDAQERHWLQVNGIHLADNPAWQVDEEDDDDGNSTPTITRRLEDTPDGAAWDQAGTSSQDMPQPPRSLYWSAGTRDRVTQAHAN